MSRMQNVLLIKELRRLFPWKRIAIGLTSWDLHNSEEKPCEYLQNECPFLSNFINQYFPEAYIFGVSAQGWEYDKKMDIDDFLSANTSGLIYAKLDDGDFIKDIMVINHKSDVIVHTVNKALRFSMDEVPHLNRATKGNRSLGTDDPIIGVSVVLHDTTDIIIVSKRGYVNRIPVVGFPRDSRAKSPKKVIKLGKGDCIAGVYGLNTKDSVNITTSEGNSMVLKVDDIPLGSSVSTGVKMIKGRTEEAVKCVFQKG